ncbi:hypothetical protein D3C73_1156740 [compost metagenome]
MIIIPAIKGTGTGLASNIAVEVLALRGIIGRILLNDLLGRHSSFLAGYIYYQCRPRITISPGRRNLHYKDHRPKQV